MVAGPDSRLGVGLGVDEVYDSNYQRVARIAAGNGYQADLHDVQITPQGSAFITAFSPVHADLSAAGGARRGTVLDAVLQQVDIKTGLVMFEWHAFAHVPLEDSYTKPRGAHEPWDYFHINSVSLDPWGDGNFIISSRNTCAAYEICTALDASCGASEERRPSFHMGAGSGIAYQHDVRWHPDHTLTIFDDGAYPKVHAQSRVIRERIDWSTRTVRVVGRDVHDPPVLAGSQGNNELLPDGGSFVGWGEAPYLSEFGTSGQMLFDARLPPTGASYRAFRFAWDATPTTRPALAVRPAASGPVSLYASWNGATGVSEWRFLAGTSPSTLRPIATIPRTGFETRSSPSSAGPWFAAQAIGPAGATLATSFAAHR